MYIMTLGGLEKIYMFFWLNWVVLFKFWPNFFLRKTRNPRNAFLGELRFFPTGKVNPGSRPLDDLLPTVGQTVRCYSSRESVAGALCVDCPVHTRHVRCATRALADCPLLGFFSLFSWAPFGLEYASFRSPFEVMHPQSFSPILFASCEL
jgi:hypothetical protein